MGCDGCATTARLGPHNADNEADGAVLGVSDAALIAVYRQHFRFAWRLCRSLGVSTADVDDVVHDVFMVVRKRLADRDPEIPIRAWLGRVVRNLVMHHHRSVARRDARQRRGPEPRADRMPDEHVEVREAAALLERFLERLEPNKREVFVLMEVEGMSAPEVSVIVGAKTATTYTRLRAARREFAAYVASLEPARVESNRMPRRGHAGSH